MLAESFGIHVVGALVDVDELRQRSRLRDSLGRGDEGVWDCYHDVALCHSSCHQRKTEGVRTAVDCYCVFGVAERGKPFFKILHHRAANEASGANYLLKNCGELLLELDMRCDQIKKRNILRMI